MKARILISVLVVIFSVSLIYAGNPKITTYTNIETTEGGTIKEYTFLDSKTLKPMKRAVYKYDATNIVQEKVTYNWSNNYGWVEAQKYEYQYNNDNQLANIVYKLWDRNQKTWSNDSKYIAHKYDKSGSLLSVENIQVNTYDLAEIR